MSKENGCDSVCRNRSLILDFPTARSSPLLLRWGLRLRLAGAFGLALGFGPRAIVTRLACGVVLECGAGRRLLGRHRLLVLRRCPVGKECERRSGGGYSQGLEQCLWQGRRLPW